LRRPAGQVTSSQVWGRSKQEFLNSYRCGAGASKISDFCGYELGLNFSGVRQEQTKNFKLSKALMQIKKIATGSPNKA